MADQKSKESAAPEEATAAPEPEPAYEPAPVEAELPAKGSDSADTPSGAALLKAGLPDPDGDPDKERERGEKYAAEKAKKRWAS
jgi:hypothetical protein